MEALTPPTERWPFRVFVVFSVFDKDGFKVFIGDTPGDVHIRSAGFYGGTGIEVGGINGIVEFGGFALVSFMHGF